MRNRRGFTLIELMIVASIISVLSAIAIPKFAELIRKSHEGSTKGNLGALRSALAIYYGDMEGQAARCAWATNSNVFSSGLVPKYIKEVPLARVGANYHADRSTVMCHWYIYQYDEHDGSAGWIYDGAPLGGVYDGSLGQVWVDCTHTDSKGTRWTAY